MDTAEILELSQEFAELGRDMRGDGDNEAALRRIVELCVKHIDGCSFASITSARGRKGTSLAVSDATAARVDSIQYELDEGPCMQAAEQDTSYLAFDLENEVRWPNFAQRTIATTPVRSVLAFRLVAGGPTALNLYAVAPGAFDDDAIDSATILAAHTSGLVALNNAGEQVTNLEQALQSNREIGVALGVLMAHHRVTQEQAFALLRVASQNLHRKLRDIAADVVETGALPEHGSGREALPRDSAAAVPATLPA
ncbi:MAG: hypothetical protein QOH56_3145 [Pseudonocardiales bacterium]|nr:hypothetical protein [Pseudonocardiales bacterium]